MLSSWSAALTVFPSLAAVQVVEGRDGGKLSGFEAFFKSSVHASPLLYDIDFDGIQDILVATYDGEILFFKDTVGPPGFIPIVKVLAKSISIMQVNHK